jgi:Ca2+-binding RTX toxin-like protein
MKYYVAVGIAAAVLIFAFITANVASAHHAYPVHLTNRSDVFSLNTMRAVHVWAYDGNDHVHVGNYNDWLEGMRGNDYLNGGGGNDTLR